MSSELEVNYSLKDVDEFGGSVKADFLNAGLTLKNNFGDLRLAAASRYAYPGLFLSTLQTNGDYRPRFADLQVLANYSLTNNSSLEVFLLYASNAFDLTPTDWSDGFGGFRRGDSRGLEILY